MTETVLRHRLAVLLTTHERAATTLTCLEALMEQDVEAQIDVYVADAGSRDGTPEEIARRFPDVDVFDVGADVFWNRGMYRAWQRARAEGYDAYLWLNDDTILRPDALHTLLSSWARVPDPAIVVGSTIDPATGELTYGGVHRPDRWRPLHYERVPPADAPQQAETMNGNCVLVAESVVERIGLLDPSYVHGMGDFDYGHRAVAAGCGVWVATEVVGTCPRNAPATAIGPRQRWQQLRRPTGLPPRDFARFARRWAGPLWPVYWLSPYLRRLVRSVPRT